MKKLLEQPTIKKACAQEARIRRALYGRGLFVINPFEEVFEKLLGAINATDRVERAGSISAAEAAEISGVLFNLARQVREIFRARPAILIVTKDGKCPVCGRAVDAVRKRGAKGEFCPACGGGRRS